MLPIIITADASRFNVFTRKFGIVAAPLGEQDSLVHKVLMIILGPFKLLSL